MFRLLFIILILTQPAYAVDANLVYWDSTEGEKRFEQSSARADFFKLSNNFESQQNKIYCGVASSVIILNSLRLKNDDYSKPLADLLMPEGDRGYLPHGMVPVFERYTQNNVFPEDPAVKSKFEILGKPVKIRGNIMADYGLQLRQLQKFLRGHGLEVKIRVANGNLSPEKIKKEMIENLKTKGDYILVNYLRARLGQVGGGHISPVGAYDEGSDSFLIMDVNPNKAGWAWIKSIDLISAMSTFDTVENRGYLLIKEYDTSHEIDGG